MNMGTGATSGASAGGIKPVPMQQLGVADWQGMKITADAMTPVPFIVYNGTTSQEIKPAKNTSFHLMVQLNDAQTGVVIPYASVWATVTKGSAMPFDDRLWPMISRYMGPHYGDDVEPSRGRHLQADPAGFPAGVRPPPGVPERVAEAAPGDLHLPLGGDAGVMSGMPMLGRALASLTRRRFLLGAGAVAGAGAAVAAGVAIDRAVDTGGPAAAGGPSAAPVPSVPLGAQPAGLPARQHAWNAVLARDQYGNPIPPLFDRLLFFDVNGHPSAARARAPRGGAAHARARLPLGAAGLLFTAGWGQPYFADVLHVSSPIPVATALSDFELPVIDDYHLCLHLASDDEPRLAAVEAALVRGAPLPGADGPLDVSSALRWRETRTGFIGTGPARRAPGCRRHPRRRSRSRPPRRCSWGSSRA